jgi:UDP:flavonoid glycosyltransferase YjiC (YdhE family)
VPAGAFWHRGLVKILFATAPGYGLMLPLVPLMWAARAAGHEVLLATSSSMTEVGARAGLPVVDVFPDRDVWADLMRSIRDPDSVKSLPPVYRRAAGAGNPFVMFTLTMTGGTIAAGRAFGADVVVYTSDHAAGALTAAALGVPALEVGNRVSWSMRDADFRESHSMFNDDEITRSLRDEFAIGEGMPNLVARIDPRAPSMGGLVEDEPDPADGVPWWSMRYVPYNGGTAVPPWALETPVKPRICVTLGTVVPVMQGTSSLSVVVEALGALDVEVVLAMGDMDLTELGALPDNTRSAGFLPLSAFLPSCSLVVHHGGSGTTAAPLHYGVPQLVLPAFADNPMSAQRVVDRGVGLRHDPTTIDVTIVRDLVGRLLAEPSFAEAAAQVRDEMATQPSPSAIIDRLSRAL